MMAVDSRLEIARAYLGKKLVKEKELFNLIIVKNKGPPLNSRAAYMKASIYPIF